MRVFAILPILLFLAACPLHGYASDKAGEIVLAQLITGTPEQKLQKLLRPHFYYGGHVTPDIKAATGDPDIPVIDRRWQWGEVYSCNYIFLKGRYRGRALICD